MSQTKIEHLGLASSDNSSPLLSVIIPVYNMAHLVERALDGVAIQEPGPNELVIVDDVSSDDSADVIRRWAAGANMPVTLISNERNLGQPGSLNVGLAQVRGRYIAFLDHDDYWEPGRLARHLSVFEESGPNCGAVYGDARVIDGSGALIRESFIDYFLPMLRPSGDIFTELLYRQNFMHISAVTLRREVVDAVGRFDEAITFEDYDYWLRVASKYQFVHSNSSDAVITWLPDSMSQSLGNDLFRGYLMSWAKWRKDPRVDRKRLRGQSANAVLAISGARQFTLTSAATATFEGTRLSRDPQLPLVSSYLFGRVTASRIRNRLCKRG